MRFGLQLSLILSLVQGSSVADLTETMSMMNLESPSASSIASDFASIREGSFTSVLDFRKSFPLQQLMKVKPHLFLNSDGIDLFIQLAADLGCTRDEAVDDFVSHNFNQIDNALLKILGSTNDAVIAAVLIDPLGATEAHFLYPIVELIDDYIRVRSRRCLLDFLPDVFEDPAVYDTYFTPINDYRVIPREDIGYTAVIPTEPSLAMMRQLGGGWRVEGRKGMLSIYAQPRYEQSVTTVIDIRKGCAVHVNHPYNLRNIVDLDYWLVVDSPDGLLVWRKDSVTPLLVPKLPFRLFVDLSHVLVGDHVILPTDLNKPFVATRIDTLSEPVAVLPVKSFHKLVSTGYRSNIYNSDIAVVTRGRYDLSGKFGARLATALSQAYGATPLLQQADGITAVFSVVNLLHVGRYHCAYMAAMELSARFNLKSMDELVQFIISVVNGERPLGVEQPLPVRYISNAERRQSDLSSTAARNRSQSWSRENVTKPIRRLRDYLAERGLSIPRFCMCASASVGLCWLVTQRCILRRRLSDVRYIIALGMSALVTARILGPRQ